MATNADNQLERYREIDRMSEQQSVSLRQMAAQITPQFIAAHGSEIVRSCKELQALSIQSRTYLRQLSMKYAHDSDKLAKMISGAERRLDRQLDELSMLRRALLSLPAAYGNPALMAQQRQILDAIAMAQDSFNHEIDRLYDL